MKFSLLSFHGKDNHSECEKQLFDHLGKPVSKSHSNIEGTLKKKYHWTKNLILYLQVYYLGEGEESKEWLQQEENTIEKLCLAHMKAVANHVVSTHPTVKPIVWDDMLRRTSKETLRGR